MLARDLNPQDVPLPPQVNCPPQAIFNSRGCDFQLSSQSTESNEIKDYTRAVVDLAFALMTASIWFYIFRKVPVPLRKD